MPNDLLLEILFFLYGTNYAVDFPFQFSNSVQKILLLVLYQNFWNFCFRNEKNQLFLGIRRAIRPQTVMPSSVLSSDSMHIGLLAAAAHAAATNSCFTVFYNPRLYFITAGCNISSFDIFVFAYLTKLFHIRASPSEFVIPFTKYVQAVYHTRVSVGMRFRMLFETEESSVRRYILLAPNLTVS